MNFRYAGAHRPTGAILLADSKSRNFNGFQSAYQTGLHRCLLHYHSRIKQEDPSLRLHIFLRSIFPLDSDVTTRSTSLFPSSVKLYRSSSERMKFCWLNV